MRSWDEIKERIEPYLWWQIVRLLIFLVAIPFIVLIELIVDLFSSRDPDEN